MWKESNKLPKILILANSNRYCRILHGQLNLGYTSRAPVRLLFPSKWLKSSSAKIRYTITWAVIRILCYLKKRLDLCLKLPKLDTSSIELRTYSDASFSINEDETSKIRYIIYLANKYIFYHPTTWSFHKSRRVTWSVFGQWIYVSYGTCGIWHGILYQIWPRPYHGTKDTIVNVYRPWFSTLHQNESHGNHEEATNDKLTGRSGCIL